MFDLNWHYKVTSESTDSMGDCSTDSYQTCVLQCRIPIGVVS